MGKGRRGTLVMNLWAKVNTYTITPDQVAIAREVTTGELHAAPSEKRTCTETPIGAKHHIHTQTDQNEYEQLRYMRHR